MKFWGILVLFHASLSFADLNSDFEELKNSGTNFEVVGVICEQVAKLEMEDVFNPREYEVVTGIQYGDKTRVIGELDIVVIDRQSQQAALIGEVKCWKNLKSAHNKAMKQRQRFLDQIHSDNRLFFKSTTTGRVFDQQQFEGIEEFISISQKGGESAGFTQSLEYTLDELMELRRQIIECQNTHQCTPPAH